MSRKKEVPVFMKTGTRVISLRSYGVGVTDDVTVNTGVTLGKRTLLVGPEVLVGGRVAVAVTKLRGMTSFCPTWIAF